MCVPLSNAKVYGAKSGFFIKFYKIVVTGIC